ncbi:MAG: hemoblobin-interacting domain-containing protein [Eubacterium sp.]
MKSAKKSGSSIIVKFDGEDAAAETYLNKLTSVKVGDAQYQKGLLGVNDGQYMADNDPVYGGKRSMLKLSASGFSADEDTTVELKADGYKTLTFVIDKNGNLKGADAGEAAVKKMTVVPELYFDQNQHYLQLSSSNQDYLAWLKKIQSVSVNDTELKQDKNTWSANAYGVSDAYVNGETSLVLTSDTLQAGDNTVKIMADGYETVTLKIKKTKGNGFFTPDTFTIE